MKVSFKKVFFFNFVKKVGCMNIIIFILKTITVIKFNVLFLKLKSVGI